MEELKAFINEKIKADILKKTRKREVVEARMLFAYFSYEREKTSLQKVGNFLNKDYSTILYYLRNYKVCKKQSVFLQDLENATILHFKKSRLKTLRYEKLRQRLKIEISLCVRLGAKKEEQKLKERLKLIENNLYFA